MNRVLVVCSSFRDYGKLLKSAFEDNGCVASLYETPMLGIKPYHVFTRLIRKCGFSVANYYKKMINKVSKKVYKSFSSFKPDIVFINLGNMIEYDDLRRMSEQSYMILYLPDPLSKVREIETSLHLFKRIYTYEKTDVKNIMKHTSSADVGLMFGMFDPRAYFPMTLPKKYDIYFVGAIYPFRAIILIRLIKDFPHLNIMIDGNYTDFPESKKMISKLNCKQKSFFSNNNISSAEINVKYNQSKIVLNLQHPQTKDGWNSRLTEILGAKSFEIVTANHSVESEFDGCLETYKDYDDLKKKILEYIEDEKARMEKAKNGYIRVVNNYSYKVAIKKVLNDIQNESTTKRV